jgi:hypothetical protein
LKQCALVATLAIPTIRSLFHTEQATAFRYLGIRKTSHRNQRQPGAAATSFESRQGQ